MNIITAMVSRAYNTQVLSELHHEYNYCNGELLLLLSLQGYGIEQDKQLRLILRLNPNGVVYGLYRS